MENICFQAVMVSQLFLTHSEVEMVEGQWEQRQKTLTYACVRITLSNVLWDAACGCTLG